MQNLKRKNSPQGVIALLISATLGGGLYYADVAGVPVISNWLDSLQDWLNGACPILESMPPNIGMIASSIVAALVFFLFLTIALAFLIPGKGVAAIEARLKRRRERLENKRRSVQAK